MILAMENEEKKFTLADPFRRALAFMLDGMFAIALGIGIYFALGNTAISALRGEAQERQAVQAYVDEAHIADDSGRAISYEARNGAEFGYAKYEAIVWEYYTVFIPNNDNAAFLESDAFSGDIKNPVDVGKWVYAHVYKLDNEATVNLEVQPYYTFTDPIDYTKRPVLNPDVEAALQQELASEASSSDAMSQKLLDYYYTGGSSSASGLYVDVFRHFLKQPYYLGLSDSLTLTNYYKTLPSYVVSPIIVYLVLPLFFKRGQTLAKLLLKLGVADENGDDAKKSKIFLHGIYPTLAVLPFATPLAGIYAILIMAVLIAIDLLGGKFMKKAPSLHETLSGTRVVELRQLNPNPLGLNQNQATPVSISGEEVPAEETAKPVEEPVIEEEELPAEESPAEEEK